MKIKNPSGLVALYFMYKGDNLLGWSSCWGTIYVEKGYETCDWLIAHEQVHQDQMKRDGKIWMMLKYAYYNMKYGYRNNPYELEAYAVSDKLRYGSEEPAL